MKPDSAPRPYRILKFGGTSVADADRLAQVADIVAGVEGSVSPVVVVSAMAGVTAALHDAAARAARSEAYEQVVIDIERRTRRAMEAVTGSTGRDRIRRTLERGLQDIHARLHGIRLLGECPPRTLDAILAWGEILSSELTAAALTLRGVRAQACDARALIVTDSGFGDAQVDHRATVERIRAHFGAPRPVQVVTGFIGRSPQGHTTTLGRGGSDYTASILGAALEADRVEIWTDVDGVMSADPRLVPGAYSLPSLSYNELMELSHFGAKVVHPRAVARARRARVPLLIRNTLHRDFPGTLVDAHVHNGSHTVRGVTSVQHVALARLEGYGIAGDPSAVPRLFAALARRDIRVVMISQGSSERSICFAIPRSGLEAARECVEREFRLERQAGLVDDLVVEDDSAVIAAVGDGMRDTPGIAGQIFSVLGHSGINVRAIAQGSSERNISCVVSREDEAAAVRALHGTLSLIHI